MRRCAHFKDLSACVNASLCDNRPVTQSTVTYYGDLITSIVCCVGIINNISCLAVFLLRGNKLTRATTHRLIVTGTSTDLLVVITGLVMCLESSLIPINPSNSGLLSNALQGSACTVISCLHLYRTWVALLTFFERYLLVSRPLRFRAHWNKTTVNCLLIACAVLVIATRVPLILNIILNLDDNLKCAPWAQSMNAFLDLLFQTLIPLIVLPLMSVGVYVTMRKSFRWRGGAVTVIPSMLSQETGKQTALRVHKTMVTVVLVYIVLMIPTLPGGILRFLLWCGAVQRNCRVRVALDLVAHVSSFLISSVDFYIYLLCCPGFRERFTHILSCARRRFSSEKRQRNRTISSNRKPTASTVYKSDFNASDM